MDTLFKPTKEDRASLNRGTRKVRLHSLKADDLIEDGFCEYCGKPGYTYKTGFLTLGGSNHHCKDMPEL